MDQVLSDPDQFGFIIPIPVIFRSIWDKGRLGYLRSKTQKYPKSLKISKEPQKYLKFYTKSDPKIKRYPKFYLNTRIIFS